VIKAIFEESKYCFDLCSMVFGYVAILFSDQVLIRASLTLQLGNCNRAQELYKEIQATGLRPTVSTFNALMTTLCEFCLWNISYTKLRLMLGFLFCRLLSDVVWETDNMDIANSVDVQLMYFQMIVTCKTSLARDFSFFCWTSKVSVCT
jgi:hypothetical protein